jgi:hypothetical protein
LESVIQNDGTDGFQWASLTMPELRDFIACNSWIFARTMPQCPHEYVLLWKCTSEDIFFRFAMTIRRFGYDEYFFSKKMRYLDVDGRRYWTMGDLLATTWVLNRALNTGPDLPHVLNQSPFINNPPNNQFPPHKRD